MMVLLDLLAQRKEFMPNSKKNTAATEKKNQWKNFGLALLLYPIMAGLMLLMAPATDRANLLHLHITIFCVFAICRTCYLAFPNSHPHLKAWISKVHAINQSLDTPQRLYRNIVVLGTTLILLGKISPGPWMIGPLSIFGAFCAFVAMYDAIRLYQ